MSLKLTIPAGYLNSEPCTNALLTLGQPRTYRDRPMKGTVGLARKGASLGISLLMLTLSLAILVLERSELVNGPVAESEHDPATCPTAHDHRICTQVGANLSAHSRVHDPIRRARGVSVRGSVPEPGFVVVQEEEIRCTFQAPH